MLHCTLFEQVIQPEQNLLFSPLVVVKLSVSFLTNYHFKSLIKQSKLCEISLFSRDILAFLGACGVHLYQWMCESPCRLRIKIILTSLSNP